LQLYGHIIGIYRRSGDRGERKVGAWKEGKRRVSKKGRERKCREAKVK